MSQGPVNNLNILSQMTNWMFADPQQGSTKRPSLRVGVFGNEPRLTVKTNVQGDLQNGKIDFNCDTPTFTAAMAFIQALAKGETQETSRQFVYQNDFVAGKKLDRIIPITTLVVGTAQDGRIYIALLSAQSSRPKIRFFFGPTKYHNILKADGSPVDPSELSKAYALAFCTASVNFVHGLMVGNAFDPNAKGCSNPANFGGGQQNGQGGGQRPGGNNNYQRNNNNDSGFQRPAGNGGAPASGGFDSFDDELPDFG